MEIDYLVKEKRMCVLESSSNYVVTLQRQESLKFYSSKNLFIYLFPLIFRVKLLLENKNSTVTQGLALYFPCARIKPKRSMLWSS